MFRCQLVEIRFRTDSFVETDGFFMSFRISAGPPPPNNLPYHVIRSQRRPTNIYKDFFARRAEQEQVENSSAAVFGKPLFMIALYVIIAL